MRSYHQSGANRRKDPLACRRVLRVGGTTLLAFAADRHSVLEVTPILAVPTSDWDLFAQDARAKEPVGKISLWQSRTAHFSSVSGRTEKPGGLGAGGAPRDTKPLKINHALEPSGQMAHKPITAARSAASKTGILGEAVFVGRAAIAVCAAATFLLVEAQVSPAFALLPLFAKPQSTLKTLSKENILELLKGDVSPKRVAEMARQHRVDFEVTPEDEKELRQAGADDALMAALRKFAPQHQPQAIPAGSSLKIQSSPGGAQVFVDDVLIARTSQEGRLVIPSLAPGKHRLRISLEGYNDYEADIDLAPALSMLVTAALETRNQALPEPAHSIEHPSRTAGESGQEKHQEREEVPAAEKHLHWHGVIVMMNRDRSTMDVRRGNVVRKVYFDASTQWRKGYADANAEMTDFTAGSEVMCLGKFDENGSFIAAQVDLMASGQKP
jgi:hypothetical protein